MDSSLEARTLLYSTLNEMVEQLTIWTALRLGQLAAGRDIGGGEDYALLYRLLIRISVEK